MHDTTHNAGHRSRHAAGATLALLLAAAVGVGLPCRASFAQGKAARTAKPAPAATGTAPSGDEDPKVKVERGAGGKKVYRIEGEIRIEGKIQKPEAFYVLQKSGMNYDWQELEQNFLPKITESVRRAPF